MSYALCPYCGQPMLPRGVKKKPNEHDHASGCPRAPKKTEGTPVKWGNLDHLGEFDEVWARNALVHVERMDETAFWIGIDLPYGKRISINTGVYRGEWFFNIDEDGGKHFSVRRPRNSKTTLPSTESLAQGIRLNAAAGKAGNKKGASPAACAPRNR